MIKDLEANNLPRQMEIAELSEIGVICLKRSPLPACGPGELLVRVAYSGICGSDLRTYRGCHPYKRAPAVLGHEFSGTIVAKGAAVHSFEVGQRVVAAAYVGCGECLACRQSEEQLCHNKRALSHQGWQGSFAEYIVLDQRMTFRLPASIDLLRGALVEPLTIGLHALRQAARLQGRTVLIIGSGNIGLATLICAKRMGAARIVCTDLGAGAKRTRALQCGADHYVDVADGGFPDTIAHCLGGGADVVLVCSGHDTALHEAVASTRPGGAIIVVSYFDHDIALCINALVRNEITFHCSAMSNADDFHQVLAWLAEGSIDPMPMVSDRFALDQADVAMKFMHGHGATVGKIVLTVDHGVAP